MSNKQNKIYFKPATQISNTGDLLINRSELALLRNYGEVIIDDSNTPAWFIDSIGDFTTDKKLSEISDLPLVATIKKELAGRASKSKNAGAVYLFIQPGHTSRSGLKNAYYHLKNDPFWRLWFRGCRICRIGFSIGPFDRYYGIKESLSSRYYKYYAVRDSESLKLAKRLNFHNPQSFPDLAFAYKVNETVAKKNEVILSFRSNEYGSKHNSDYLKPIIERIKILLGASQIKSHKIVITYQVSFDKDPAHEIYMALKDEFDTVLIDRQLSLEDATTIYAGADCVISNRLHVVLLALQCNTLALSLVNYKGNSKVTSILEDNGLKNLILNREDSVELNMTIFQNALQHSAEILEKYKKQSEENYSKIIDKLNKLFEVG